MATFPTPLPSELGEGLRCVIVFIPEDDNALFLADLLGQYSQFLRPFQWDGSYDEKDRIVQLWHVAYAKTLEWLEDGYCKEFIDEDGNMAINISVNCEGGGSGGGDCIQTVTVPNYNTGNGVCLPIETSPVVPPTVPPLTGDGVGEFIPPSPIYPNDPPYTGDNSMYNAERCSLAEFAFEYLRQWVQYWKDVDNQILTIAGLILAVNASPLSAVIAWLTRLSASTLIELTSSILAIVQAVTLWDEWVDDLLAIIDGKKDEFICAVYNATDTENAVTIWLQEVISDTLTQWQARSDWDVKIFQIAENLLASLLVSTPLSAMVRLATIPPEFEASFDCSTCSGLPDVAGFTWIRSRFGSEIPPASNPNNMSVSFSDNRLTAVFSRVDSGGASRLFNWDSDEALNVVGLPVNSTVAGIYFQTIQSSPDNDLWRILDGWGNADWSPREPCGSIGFQQFIRNTSVVDQSVLDFGASMLAGCGTTQATGTGKPDTFNVNFNGSIQYNETLIVECWFLIENQ